MVGRRRRSERRWLAGVGRGGATGCGWARGDHRDVARALPHQEEAELGAVVAGIMPAMSFGGGRSSGGCGVGARGHVGRSWWWLRPPGDVLSAVVCSASSYNGSSHGGDEARRRRASELKGAAATGC